MKLSIIAAVSLNDVIGNNGKLPWHLATDLRRFKELTWGHPIIMGRRTHESIGRPLPGRLNIVLSKQNDFQVHDCQIVGDFDHALEAATQVSDEAFVIGGREVFKNALALAEVIYLTKVHAVVEGDTVLALDLHEWHETEATEIAADHENEYPFSFVTLQKRPGGSLS